MYREFSFRLICLITDITAPANTVFVFFHLGNDYMSSEAVVITILVKNAVDHRSPTVLMAQAWESEFIRTVLKWRSEHPEIVVSFAAEVRSHYLEVELYVLVSRKLSMQTVEYYSLRGWECTHTLDSIVLYSIKI